MNINDVIGLVDLDVISDINLYVFDDKKFKQLVDLYVIDNLKSRYKNIVRGSIWFDDMKCDCLPEVGKLNVKMVGNNTLDESNLTIYI